MWNVNVQSRKQLHAKAANLLPNLSCAETDVESNLTPYHTTVNICHPSGHALSSLPVVEGMQESKHCRETFRQLKLGDMNQDYIPGVKLLLFMNSLDSDISHKCCSTFKKFLGCMQTGSLGTQIASKQFTHGLHRMLSSLEIREELKSSISCNVTFPGEKIRH